ncbi:MAG: SRPBCC family protein [Flavobacteriales bacterium]|nr:SRPBCC family protein [Flavobacteriales bacterium]
MKTALKISLFLLMGFVVNTAQAKEKKVKSFIVERVFDIEAAKIWKIVGLDYGSVAYSHPRIVKSEYLKGSLKAEEGAERVCYFNEEGTQYLKEKMLNYEPEKMRFVNQISQVGKFPLDAEVTRAIYQVTDLGNGKSKLSFDMQFRTKPAFMGAMMKGNFKKTIQDYFIAIEHHARTGEEVTKENFKEIKKKYN